MTMGSVEEAQEAILKFDGTVSGNCTICLSYVVFLIFV